jgi:transcriptional regulator of acetoin/glycerol metabolism
MGDTRTSPLGDGEKSLPRLRRISLVYPPDRLRTWRLGERSAVIGRKVDEEHAIRLDDPEASGRHAELWYSAKTNDFRLRDLGSKNGTFLGGQRIENEFLPPSSVIRIGGSLFIYSELKAPRELPIALGLDPSISLALQYADHLADRIALRELPVLINGPTGAGKELLARRIHEKSGRTGKMVPVNCATLTGELAHSELFGWVRGAFTGAASDRPGLFQRAEGGTLFLDEIAELPLPQQAALLRVLQDKRVRHLGTDDDHEVDVRVVAATHRDLKQLVREKAFREDLRGRIAGMTISLPGLSERREDVLPLMHHFLGKNDVALAIDAAEALLTHEWPGNVRELEHLAEQLVAFRPSGIVTAEDLMIDGAVPEADEPGRPSKERIEALLAERSGVIAKVARDLDTHPTQVQRWIRRLGIRVDAFRPGKKGAD